MRVAMIGSGYVGLVSGACFADFGHKVTCVDKDASKIDRLRAAKFRSSSPGLDRLVARQVRERAALLHDRSARTGGRGGGGVHRRRHAVAARRRPRRSHLRLHGRARDRRRGRRLHRGRHQVDGAGRHRRRGRADHRRGAARRRIRRRLQSGISARGRRDRGLQAARPHRRRHRGRARRAR